MRIKPHSNRHKALRSVVPGLDSPSQYQWRRIMVRRPVLEEVEGEVIAVSKMVPRLQARLWPGSARAIYQSMKKENIDVRANRAAW